MRRTRWFAGATCVGALLLCGCLEWDEQEVRVACDDALDRIDAQIVYRGLYSSATRPFRWIGVAPLVEDGQGTDEELEQLIAGRPMFALFAGMTGCDVAAWRESTDPLVAALGARIAVDQGAFFRAEDGRLCAWQHVRISDVTGVLAMCDTLWRRSFARDGDLQSLRAALGVDDAESVRRWQEFAAKQERWFKSRDPSIVAHVPASDRAARALVDRIEGARPFATVAADWDAFETKAATDAEPLTGSARSANAASAAAVSRSATQPPTSAETCAAFLKMLGVRGEPVDGGVELRLELRGEAIRLPSIAHPEEGKRFELLPHLEKRKVAVRTDVTDELLRAKFAEFRSY